MVPRLRGDDGSTSWDDGSTSGDDGGTSGDDGGTSGDDGLGEFSDSHLCEDDGIKVILKIMKIYLSKSCAMF